MPTNTLSKINQETKIQPTNERTVLIQSGKQWISVGGVRLPLKSGLDDSPAHAALCRVSGMNEER